MAKNKGKRDSNKSAYISKGLVPNISRSTVLGMRRDSRNPISVIMAQDRSDTHKHKIMSRPQNAAQRTLAAKYEKEFRERERANELLRQFEYVGLTKAAAIQAVRTNWEGKLIEKYLAKTQEFENKMRGLMKSRRISRDDAILVMRGKQPKSSINLRA